MFWVGTIGVQDWLIKSTNWVQHTVDLGYFYLRGKLASNPVADTNLVWGQKPIKSSNSASLSIQTCTLDGNRDFLLSVLVHKPSQLWLFLPIESENLILSLSRVGLPSQVMIILGFQPHPIDMVQIISLARPLIKGSTKLAFNREDSIEITPLVRSSTHIYVVRQCAYTHSYTCHNIPVTALMCCHNVRNNWSGFRLEKKILH